jgi:hypothetical protein
MRNIKFNLKELMADAAKDEAATKPAHKIISQDNISALLKKTKLSVQEANRHET